LPSALPATIFIIPFDLPRLSRLVAPQNARVNLPDHDKAKGLPCAGFYASWWRRSHMERRQDIARRRRQARRLPSIFNLPPTATFASF
jgi:hypothetical protein